jgi:hypothetical protein
MTALGVPSSKAGQLAVLDTLGFLGVRSGARRRHVERLGDRLGVVPHPIMLDIDEALRLHFGTVALRLATYRGIGVFRAGQPTGLRKDFGGVRVNSDVIGPQRRS